MSAKSIALTPAIYFIASFSITFSDLKNNLFLPSVSLSLCYVFLSSMMVSLNILK